MDLKKVGAHYDEHKGTSFCVWAPLASQVEIEVLSNESWSRRRLEKGERGYFQATFSDVGPGFRYYYVLDGKKRLADPASRYQPDGVHGPSQVVASTFHWGDAEWKGLSLDSLVFYELHVGTFTQKGTFDATIEKLPYLRDLGVTAIEIMPVAQFPGTWNWGYDGVLPFAAQNTYGGPEGLKRLVNSAHQHGLAVYLDVVYNHVGPEGNVLPQFGPYFQDKYKTPWGQALNYDGAGSDEVRNYFLQNAQQWLDEFHFDGLRLDAVHAICDMSAQPFLEQLTNLKRSLEARVGRALHLVAETDMNDARMLQPSERGGTGMDAHWNDDFHHTLHSLLTGEEQGYYKGFRSLENLARIYQRGVLFEGQYQPSRGCSHGRPYGEISRDRLVVCIQNHDQIGNRMKGERVASLVNRDKVDLAAAAVMLSPFCPLIFMGEEMGETQPFLYFIDHEDKGLVEAVRKGRAAEFGSFGWKENPPDPASLETVNASRPQWKKLDEPKSPAQALVAWYRQLIEASKWIRQKGFAKAGALRAQVEGQTLVLSGESRNGALLWAALSFDENESSVRAPDWSTKPTWSLHSRNMGSAPGAAFRLKPFGAVAAGFEPRSR